MNMHKYLFATHHDLISPDGIITQIDPLDHASRVALIEITGISPNFVGFQIGVENVYFNFKSTLAQIGLNSETIELEVNEKLCAAKIRIRINALDLLSLDLLKLLTPGAYVGKLFAADDRRRVKKPDYLSRMFGRTDRIGNPLLSLDGAEGDTDLILEQNEGRLIAYLKLQQGRYSYAPEMTGFLPTIAKALHNPKFELREMLKLHQVWNENAPRTVKKDEVLLVRTTPLHIRTCFGKVVDNLLPQGFKHTSASVLQPDTTASGDVYELYGHSSAEIPNIPLEFYTLEPYREHVSFADRDQLQICLENPQTIFDAFAKATAPSHHKAAVFIVKGTQFKELKSDDWIYQDTYKTELPGIFHTERQAQLVENYIHQQPAYPFLKAIEEGQITSQGILLSRYFPSPLMKRMLLSEQVQRCLKGIYFHTPSQDGGEYFSHEDRALLFDLAKFGIPTYWADKRTHRLLQYVPKPDKDSGMFVPMDAIEAFTEATFVGIYGSNLISGNYGEELSLILEGLKTMSARVNHPLLHPGKPLAMVTGGGPGAMSIGNQVAQKEQILSCANIVDFTSQGGCIVNEQEQNPYIDIKMTYRLDKLVERQAEFYLDLPIFLTGGIGTDFEYTLEEVRRKTGVCEPTPVILLGMSDYWKAKIQSRFNENLKSGTIKGSEWVSNCFYSVPNAKAALSVYYDFFTGVLPIGKSGPVASNGFVIYE